MDIINFIDICDWLIAIVGIAKTAEPIEMPFAVWTRVGPRNHILDGVQIPHAKGQMTDGWLKEQDQQFFYNGIRVSDQLHFSCRKKTTKCDVHIL